MTPHATLRVPPPSRGELKAGENLAAHIWFRCGGPAEWFFRPADMDDLASFLAALPAHVPVQTIGLGSNLIVRDDGVAGVTVRLPKSFADIDVQGHDIMAGAGATGVSLAQAACKAGLGGFEFLRGIPGTIGGAVRMNAGAYGREMADLLVSATIVTRAGTIKNVARDDMAYAYRSSGLRDDDIVVRAHLRGVPKPQADIERDMARIMQEREDSQPLRTRTGGSTFKNPPGQKAWRLIDEAGCRGLRHGGAQVSEKHTNFLINTGGATSHDLESLGEDVRQRVRATSGMDLTWEIRFLGNKS